jgi:hypothetical protein
MDLPAEHVRRSATSTLNAYALLPPPERPSAAQIDATSVQMRSSTGSACDEPRPQRQAQLGQAAEHFVVAQLRNASLTSAPLADFCAMGTRYRHGFQPFCPPWNAQE